MQSAFKGAKSTRKWQPLLLFLSALHVHMEQMLVLGFDWGVEKPYYRQKAPLVVGGTRTYVFADSMTIALNHCETSTIIFTKNCPPLQN